MSTHAFAPTFGRFDLLANAAHVDPSGDLAVDATALPFGTEPSYALVQSGPAVPADEVECDVDAIEITARWGAQVLGVAHLEPGEPFFVGEGSELALPEELLGAARAAIVEAGCVAVPGGAHATVTSAEGIAQIEGPTTIPLAPSSRVSMDLGGVTFEIATVRKGKVAKGSLLASLASGVTGFIGASLLGHAALVASMAMFTPAMSNDVESIDRDQILMMQKLLNASAERQLEPEKPTPGPSAEASGGGAKGGEPHAGPSGAAGTPTAQPRAAHMAFKGDDRESALALKQEVALFGMVGLLAGGVERDPAAHASPWAEALKGSDAESKMGGLIGFDPGDAFGYGIGLSGNEEGGGGKGVGVGIDGIGSTVGGGGGGTGRWGYGKGDQDGMGNSHGRPGGHHEVKVPRMTTMQLSTNGRLPAEVIQRVVRQNFGRFRACYESGLRTNPSLTGRVSTKFVIDRSGGVGLSQDAGSDLPDQAVVQCVVRSFASLSFPAPEGGAATVVYPLMLSPGQ